MAYCILSFISGFKVLTLPLVDLEHIVEFKEIVGMQQEKCLWHRVLEMLTKLIDLLLSETIWEDYLSLGSNFMYYTFNKVRDFGGNAGHSLDLIRKV